jgi:hypothetical protein
MAMPHSSVIADIWGPQKETSHLLAGLLVVLVGFLHVQGHQVPLLSDA